METQEIKQASYTLMKKAEAAYLTTIDRDGVPHTRAMLNLRNPKQYPGLIKFFEEYGDNFVIYFSTNTSSEKIAQIRANPLISVYFCAPKKFHGFMLGGSVEIMTDEAIKHALWQEGWEVYYPKGRNDPDYAVLRLIPGFIEGWHKMTRFKVDLRETS
jgi:general stress protein 26